MKFYLGTHSVNWLWTADGPAHLFVSHRRLAMRKRPFPRARRTWVLDSAGFTELSLHGQWQIPERDYIASTRRYRDELGGLEWAAPQDWMCEKIIREGGVDKNGKVIAVGTKLSVIEHQTRTIDSVLSLRAHAPDVHWAPVLQGDQPEDYLRHVDMYASRGVDLFAERIVGVGSVCRRNRVQEIVTVIRRLYDAGLRLHGFGVKRNGFAQLAPLLVSADSLAWSYNAKRNPDLRRPGCKHKTCANCRKYAMWWLGETLRQVDRSLVQVEIEEYRRRVS